MNPVTDNLDLWSSVVVNKSTAGRGKNAKQEAYGIKKLRELILELAVRGKLVAQDEGDEPAGVLLGRIAEERERLVEKGKIKKQKGLPVVSQRDKPFELPNGWVWSRVSDVGHDWGQKTPDDDFTYVDVSAIDNESGTIGSPSILSAGSAPSRARKIVHVGTVIYSTVRPYLKNICVIEEVYSPEPIASTAFAILHPFQEMPGRFFALYLRSPIFVKYVESVQTGIAYPAINDKQFYGGLTPLPPLAEQHRIVAKVDELMALCDQLEQKQTDSIAAHQTLVETLLGTLVNVESQQELTEAWNRLTNHFDTLFTTEQSIDQLKQTILQLAVMGKLVPQDPEDEPARVLLERIAVERVRLVEEGEIKKGKQGSVSKDDKTPFQLPIDWEWSHLPEIGELARGKSKHRPRNDEKLYIKGNIPMVQTGDVSKADPIISTYTALYNEEGLGQSRLWPKGTMCITIAANIADTGILGFDACFPDSVVGFIPLEDKLNVSYFEYFIRTAKSHLEDFAPSTAQKNINLEILGKLLVPLPPLRELERIVKKVNQLTTLCDTLKASLNEAQTTKTHLANAIVKQAVV